MRDARFVTNDDPLSTATDRRRIEIIPIGMVRNDRTARGAGDWDRVNSRIELDLGLLGDDATDGLRAFSHVEVVFLPGSGITAEHAAASRRPAGDTPAESSVGILAQRLGPRPNQVGTTVCELMAVRRGGTIEVRGLDAIDGSLVLDVKPFMAEFAPRGDVHQPDWSSALMSGYWTGAPDPFPQPDPAAWLEEVQRSPADHGRLAMIVRRPQVDGREVISVGDLDVVEGLVGDNWRVRGSRSTPDGSAEPQAQLNIMNIRCARLVANGDDGRVPLAGDQLFVDLDLSPENLPAGTHLRIGSAVIEVTPMPHTGCAKFTQRFGIAAHRWVNGRDGKRLRLRGICAKVVVPGTIAAGDEIVKLPED